MTCVIRCGHMMLQISFSTWEPGLGRLKLSWPSIVHRGIVWEWECPLPARGRGCGRCIERRRDCMTQKEGTLDSSQLLSSDFWEAPVPLFLPLGSERPSKDSPWLSYSDWISFLCNQRLLPGLGVSLLVCLTTKLSFWCDQIFLMYCFHLSTQVMSQCSVCILGEG